jgi:NIPSNAP
MKRYGTLIYEWRVYEMIPGKRNAVNERFAKHTLQLFEKHGLKVVGFWENKIGGTTNTLYYMLEFKDLVDLDEAWARFRADPEWQRVAAESEKDGPIIAKITNMVLTPTPYSPMK